MGTVPPLPTAPTFQRAVRRQAQNLLLPAIILTAIFGQDRPQTAMVVVGQLASIAAVALAAVVALSALAGRVWPGILVLVVVILRAIRLVPAGDMSVINQLYALATTVLFAAAGADLLLTRRKLVARQMATFVAISCPMMALQLLGVGEWTQSFRTQFAGDSGLAQHPTLLIGRDDMILSGIQARPGGFLYANNYLSVFIVFALALYLGDTHAPKRAVRNGLLATASVLSMAKVVFFAFVVMGLVAVVLRQKALLRRWGAMALMLLVLLGGYRLLFPGMFEVNMSLELWRTNFQMRLADALYASGSERAREIAGSLPTRALATLDPEVPSQSGYALLIQRTALVAPALLTAVFLNWRGARWLKRFRPDLRPSIIMLQTAVVVVPVITSFLGPQVFSVFLGVAAFPVWITLDSRFGKLALRAKG